MEQAVALSDRCDIFIDLIDYVWSGLEKHCELVDFIEVDQI